MSRETTNLLAIETTTDFCSVAIVSNGRWFEDTRLAPRLHNRLVLGMIDNVVAAAAIPRHMIDIIAFGAGPGAFTGVRIAAAVAQGIALAISARALPVPSSAVVAETGRCLSGRRGVVGVVRQCRPGWHHAARYDLADTGVECLDFDQVAAIEDCGDDVLDGARFAPSARIVAKLALDRVEEAVAAEKALPHYVEGDSPWRPSGHPLRGEPE